MKTEMKRTLLLGMGLGMTLVLSGCGGSSSSNAFQGTWSGPFQVFSSSGNSVESSGFMIITVDSFGGAQVEMQRTDSNQQTQFFNGGYIDDARFFRYVWRWNDTNDRETRGTVEINGNFLQPAAQNRRLETRFAGGSTGGMEFTLTRQ
jgi:hypothetical protein